MNKIIKFINLFVGMDETFLFPFVCLEMTIKSAQALDVVYFRKRKQRRFFPKWIKRKKIKK